MGQRTLGMHVGEKRKLKTPAKLGYGAQGCPATIPAEYAAETSGGATLTFDAEPVSVKGKPICCGGKSDKSDEEDIGIGNYL